MASSTTPSYTPTNAGRSGYNKDDDPTVNKGRSGYNGPLVDGSGRDGYNRNGDEDKNGNGGRSGYN